MVEELRRRLEGYGGRLVEAGSLDAGRERARELIGAAPTAAWEDAALHGVVAPAARAAPAEADVSLIVADVAVADTGAIGFAHGPGRPRAAAILPARQIALLARVDVVQTMAEALARFFDPETAGRPSLIDALVRSGELSADELEDHPQRLVIERTTSPWSPPSNVIFTAGPSHTADIEQRSITGVHGPRTLDVILYAG